MFRVVSLALGLLVTVFWVIALAQNATPWLAWLQGVIALLSFAMAGLPLATSVAGRAGSPAFIGLALAAMWIFGLATGATPWLAWWDLVLAMVYLGFSTMGAMEGPLERFRKPRSVS